MRCLKRRVSSPTEGRPSRRGIHYRLARADAASTTGCRPAHGRPHDRRLGLGDSPSRHRRSGVGAPPDFGTCPTVGPTGSTGGTAGIGRTRHAPRPRRAGGRRTLDRHGSALSSGFGSSRMDAGQCQRRLSRPSGPALRRVLRARGCRSEGALRFPFRQRSRGRRQYGGLHTVPLARHLAGQRRRMCRSSSRNRSSSRTCARTWR